MNILCGIAGKTRDSEIDETLKKVMALYDMKCKTVDAGNSGFAISSTDSSITGYAIKNRKSLILHGAVHRPFFKWLGHATPLDDMSATADHFLSLWQQNGTVSVGMASGSFTGCYFDMDAQKAILFCDLDGMRNVYIFHENGRVWFANNPKLLAKIAPGVTIDRSFEDFFLVYGFWPEGRTAYKDIEVLPAGNALEIGSGTTILHKLSRIENSDFPGLNHAFTETNFDDSVDILYQAFMKAVEDQTATDKKTAVLLGGVDSALVASCLKRLGKEVETFSFYYQDNSFNQPHTDTLSDFLSIKHTWVPITPEIILEGHKQWGLHYCQPTNWANYVIQTDYLCKIIKSRGITRCYSGDGCDGTFLGYPNVHKSSAVYAKSNQLPSYILWLLLASVKFDVMEYIFGRFYTVGLNTLRSFSRSGAARGFLTFRVMDELSLPRLRSENQPTQEMKTEEKLLDLSKELSHLSPDRLAYMGKNMVSPNKAKMNGCMDNSGVTVLSPYLHPDLKSIAQRIPDYFLRPDDIDRKQKRLGKYILLKMINKFKLLPDEIIYQPKISAVDAPVDNWYFNRITNEMISIMQSLPFKTNRKYINYLFKDSTIDRIYTRFFCSDSVTSHAISLLATYAAYTDLSI